MTPLFRLVWSLTAIFACVCTLTYSGLSAPTGTANPSAEFQTTSVDFSITASPSVFTMSAGQTTTFTITVAPINGFIGPITFSQTGGGQESFFTPSVVNVRSASPVTTTLTKPSLPTAFLGPRTITIKATSGSLLRTASVNLTITPAIPDFSLSVSPASRTINQGSNITYSLSISPIAGFSGTV